MWRTWNVFLMKYTSSERTFENERWKCTFQTPNKRLRQKIQDSGDIKSKWEAMKASLMCVYVCEGDWKGCQSLFVALVEISLFVSFSLSHLSAILAAPSIWSHKLIQLGISFTYRNPMKKKKMSFSENTLPTTDFAFQWCMLCRVMLCCVMYISFCVIGYLALEMPTT